MKMRLYRGIAISPPVFGEIRQSILTNGLAGDEGWSTIPFMLGLDIEQLRKRPLLSTNDTRCRQREVIGICASADYESAVYYAISHNRTASNGLGVIIEMEVDPTQVIVDGKDFLMPVFQFGDASLAREALEKIFGGKVLQYADMAWRNENHSYRIAQCDLATSDPDVVLKHSRNKIVMRGKCGTTFCNALAIAAPVRPDQIVSVSTVDDVEGNRNAQRQHNICWRDLVKLPN